jgi:hypothetical protein
MQKEECCEKEDIFYHRFFFALYDDAIDEASVLIKNLSQIDKIAEEHIWASIDPGKISNSSNDTNSTDEIIRETD